MICIRPFSNGHIDLVVNDRAKVWCFIGFYGSPQSSERAYSWDLLHCLANLNGMTWLIRGDFNEILSVEDKRGGVGRRASAMIAFQACLDGCEL